MLNVQFSRSEVELKKKAQKHTRVDFNIGQCKLSACVRFVEPLALNVNPGQTQTCRLYFAFAECVGIVKPTV